MDGRPSPRRERGSVALVPQAPRHPRLMREQLDETWRCRLREQPARFRERGQLRVVDGVLRLPRDQPRYAPLEVDGHVLPLLWRALGRGDEPEDVLLGSVSQLLDPPTLARTAPQVVVDRVRDDLRGPLDLDAVLAGIGDLLLASHLPRS